MFGHEDGHWYEFTDLKFKKEIDIGMDLHRAKIMGVKGIAWQN